MAKVYFLLEAVQRSKFFKEKVSPKTFDKIPYEYYYHAFTMRGYTTWGLEYDLPPSHFEINFVDVYVNGQKCDMRENIMGIFYDIPVGNANIQIEIQLRSNFDREFLPYVRGKQGKFIDTFDNSVKNLVYSQKVEINEGNNYFIGTLRYMDHFVLMYNGTVEYNLMPYFYHPKYAFGKNYSLSMNKLSLIGMKEHLEKRHVKLRVPLPENDPVIKPINNQIKTPVLNTGNNKEVINKANNDLSLRQPTKTSSPQLVVLNDKQEHKLDKPVIKEVAIPKLFYDVEIKDSSNKTILKGCKKDEALLNDIFKAKQEVVSDINIKKEISNLIDSSSIKENPKDIFDSKLNAYKKEYDEKIQSLKNSLEIAIYQKKNELLKDISILEEEIIHLEKIRKDKEDELINLLKSIDKNVDPNILIDQCVIKDNVLIDVKDVKEIYVDNKVKSIKLIRDINVDTVVFLKGSNLSNFKDLKAFKNVKNFVLPDNLNKLDKTTLKQFTNLEYIYIPKSYNSTPNECFKNCLNLKIVEYEPNSVSKPHNFDMGGYAFFNLPKLEVVILPKYMHSITFNSFSGADKLKYLYFPDKVYTVETGAFSYCKSLTYLNMLSDDPKGTRKLLPSSFDKLNDKCEILMDDSYKGIFNAFSGQTKNVKIVKNDEYKKHYLNKMEYLKEIKNYISKNRSEFINNIFKKEGR